MTKSSTSVIAATVVMLTIITASYSETRSQHITPEQLYDQSSMVIKGAVLDIETVAEYQLSFPVRASVDSVVKGRWREKEISFQYKHPGLHVIFEQEFNTPQINMKGTFYIQRRNDRLILIGFISDTELTQQAVELIPLSYLTPPTSIDAKEVSNIKEISIEWWLNRQMLMAEEMFIVAGYFSVIRPIAAFADRGDRVWEVRVIHLGSGAPTGIMWINDSTKKVIALGVKENTGLEQFPEVDVQKSTPEE